MKEKIFLAGTDDVKWVIEKLYDVLIDFGFTPLWFHKNFPIESDDTMKECIKNVENSDRFILVLDKRYGLPSRGAKYSITEEEFLTAYRNNKPILIFITTSTYEESKIYHRIKRTGKKTSKKKIEELGLKANKNLFEFIDRIQHLVDGNEKKICWIEQFRFVDDIIEQINHKWISGSMPEFKEFIGPWVLPNEEIPMHLTWNKDFEFSEVEIRHPNDLEVVEIINADNYSISNKNIIIKKKDIRTLIYNKNFVSYFGIVFIYRNINFDELKLFRDISIVFKNGSIEVEKKKLTAKIFRPVLINNSDLKPGIIDDTTTNYSIALNLETRGFGYVSAHIEVKINSLQISFNDSIVERIEKKLKKKYGNLLDNVNEEKFKNKLKVEKKSVKKFLEALDNYISRKNDENENITHYLSEENIEISLIVDFIIELIKEIKIQYKYDNILLKSPSLELPKESLNEIIKNLIICIHYEDLNKNIYPPLEIPFEIQDNRRKPQNTLINFKIKVNNVIDNNFYDIENIKRDNNGKN